MDAAANAVQPLVALVAVVLLARGDARRSGAAK
jgi:hypothetical protein